MNHRLDDSPGGTGLAILTRELIFVTSHFPQHFFLHYFIFQYYYFMIEYEYDKKKRACFL